MSFFESIFYMAWRGIAIGLIISAPMGPVGMLCIQRTLDKGRRAGFYTGIGAALSDLFYSLLTGFGLSFIEEFLERNSNIIQLAGSFVLIAFGIYLFKKNPTKNLKKPVDEEISVKKNILGGFLFTFSNPLILFLIVGLFARFNFLLPEFHVGQYFTGFLFIFLGAIIWWWFITFSIDKVRSHFNIRSMWLINRIIGVVILLFAVVGIFTATTALVNGTEIKTWNAMRGYGPFSTDESGTDNLLANESADTITYLTSADGADALELRCKVENLHASPMKKYPYCLNDGSKGATHSPPWGFLIKGEKEGEDINIEIRNSESVGNGLSSAPCLEAGIKINGENAVHGLFTDNTNLIEKVRNGLSGPDPTGSLNFFKIVIYKGHLTLFGGLHSPVRMLECNIPEEFRASAVGFYLTPGAAIRPEELRLSLSKFYPEESPWGDSDLLDEYLASSRDPMEGYLVTLDRSLDESLLRLGGDYRYAAVRETDGYDLIYLSGARINPDAWRRGMRKAHLRRSEIPGVWDVTWIDAMQQTLGHEIKAQTDANGTITIQFPYQNSQIRLQRVENIIPAEGNGR